MTKNDFNQALQVAASHAIDLSSYDDTILHGCGLAGFKPVAVTLGTAAKFIRYQVLQFNGTIDETEMNNLYYLFVTCRRAVLLTPEAFPLH